jgi:hypothetical protein
MLTRYGTKKIVRRIVFALIILVIIGYAIFASHDFILGPSISLSEPENGASFDTPSIRIKGVVQRIQDISLNGRSITIDDKGNFNEAVILAPGYNVFELIARDKFGRSKDYRLELVYKVN